MAQRLLVTCCFCLTAALALFSPRPTAAQVAAKANWIWFDKGEPLQSAPAETVYFRKAFDENYELAEAELHITCDNEFVLFINGKEVGRGTEWKEGKVFNVREHLVRGRNVIAVRATNSGGPAGLVAWLVQLTKPGNHYTLTTDGSWKCSNQVGDGWREPGFDDSKWPAAKSLGEYGRVGPWQEITWNGKRDASRFTVKEGFQIDQLAEPEVTGSIVNMTFDAKGRPVVSRERGPLLILDAPDESGKFTRAKPFTEKVKNCQGILCWDATTWYCIGDGPDGTGLYRLKDGDGDDEAESIELLHKFKGGMGEHGPHAVVAGPDGYLYINSGNHAWVTAMPEPGSPCQPHIDLGHLYNLGQPNGGEAVSQKVKLPGREIPLRDLLRSYEADLLPRYEDAGGHAVGIRVPGGTIWRTDPDAKRWTLETCGFRNEFDFAFNSLGEVFSFDSDMEWDEYAPWYRPVRVNHCPPGANFGWRSGSNKWPAYYLDSLPAIVDIGRGSPCGVVFYNHTLFPESYQDAFFITDWSYGRIFAIHLNREGASFKAEAEEFVTGKPLNVTDIEVARDGTVYFTTGGRGTEGGLFRIRPSSVDLAAKIENHPALAGGDAVQAAIGQPQPQSAWGREAIRNYREAAGEHWGPELGKIARASSVPIAQRLRALSYLMQFGPEPALELARDLATSDNAELRAQAAVLLARHAPTETAPGLLALVSDRHPLVQRRALEGLIRQQVPVPLDKLKPLLAGKDRFARYTARLALERQDPARWWQQIAADQNPRVVTAGLVSINEVGAVAADPAVAELAFQTELRLLDAKLSVDDQLDTLRGIQLTLVNTAPDSRPHSVGEIGKILLSRFPAGEPALDRELSRTLAAIQAPGTVDKLLDAIDKIGQTEDLAQRADAIHYARCLMGISDPPDERPDTAAAASAKLANSPPRWTWPQRQRFLRWFDVSRDWKGGHSYAGYITNFLRDAVKQLSEQELLEVVQHADKYQRAATRALAADERINDKADAAFVPALAALLHVPARPAQPSPVPQADVLLALGRTGRAEAEAILLKAYDQSSGELRDAAVRALTNFQNARNWSIFVQALDAENKETVRAAILALTGIEQKPDGPAAYRAAIAAGNRLGQQGGWDSIVLVRQWAGKHFGHKRNEWKEELDKWQKWYADTYPDAPAAKLVDAAKPQHNWNYDQLIGYLEGTGGKGSADSGRKIFEKAICSKCHRVEQVGTSVGPDLTTLSSRFKRKDILEAVIYPSRVISDQYKSYLIATKDGRVFTAMKAPDDGDNHVLLLSDASTIKLPKSDVEDMVDGKQSVMPDGLLNQFSLEEIADLFAFLESGKGK